MAIENPLISVVVPNYNNREYLTSCIESILSQSYTNLEVIIVDDCSTDDSVSIAKNFMVRDKRVKIIQNEYNCGVAISRDIGIRASAGFWITTLDSDDVLLHHQKLEKEISKGLLKMSDGAQPIVFSGIMLIDAKGKLMHSQPGRVIEGDLFLNILTRNCMIPRDFIFTLEQYTNVGGFDDKIPIYEDWDLKIRLASQFPFVYSGIHGAIGYRRHNNGLSSANPLTHALWMHKIFIKNIFLIKNKRAYICCLFYLFIAKFLHRNFLKRRHINSCELIVDQFTDFFG